jgi:outer membrane protein assembly factor BamB
VELGGDVDSSPTLAADGTIFVGSDDHKLYALRAPSGSPPMGKP